MSPASFAGFVSPSSAGFSAPFEAPSAAAGAGDALPVLNTVDLFEKGLPS